MDTHLTKLPMEGRCSEHSGAKFRLDYAGTDGCPICEALIERMTAFLRLLGSYEPAIRT